MHLVYLHIHLKLVVLTDTKTLYIAEGRLVLPIVTADARQNRDIIIDNCVEG